MATQNLVEEIKIQVWMDSLIFKNRKPNYHPGLCSEFVLCLVVRAEDFFHVLHPICFHVLPDRLHHFESCQVLLFLRILDCW